MRMPISNTREILLKATEGKYSVGAFNVTNIIQMEAVVEAAIGRSAPDTQGIGCNEASSTRMACRVYLPPGSSAGRGRLW